MAPRPSTLVLVTASIVAASSLALAKEEDKTLPPPSLVLTVVPGSAGGAWKVKIENAGEVPVRIPADPRLLSLEITPPAAEGKDGKKGATPAAVRCSLPDDVRPSTDEGQELVVPGKRSWSATFDPLFYCFGARERAALLKNATVRARFGWPATKARGAKITAPFVAAPVGAAVGQVAPAKEIESATFTLADDFGVFAASAGAAGEGDKPALSIVAQDSLDASRGAELGVTTTLTNDGDRAVTLLFRPETLAFTVSGPGGSVACGNPRTINAPIRELFTTLGAKGKTSLTVLITAICPPGTFDDAGVYRVVPRVDTSGASGRSVGLKSFDGEVRGKKVTLIRVRSPKRATATARAALD